MIQPYINFGPPQRLLEVQWDLSSIAIDACRIYSSLALATFSLTVLFTRVRRLFSLHLLPDPESSLKHLRSASLQVKTSEASATNLSPGKLKYMASPVLLSLS